MLIFSKALASFRGRAVPTPRLKLGIGETDKKKQQCEFHIHTAKLVYLDTHNQVVINRLGSRASEMQEGPGVDSLSLRRGGM